MKKHFRDIRLFSNAGIRFPMCYAGTRLLDLDKTHLSTTGVIDNVNCKHCLRLFKKRYPWASGK